MNVKDLIYSWSLPSRAGELRAYSLRIPSDTYAKFQALKQVFTGQSINDLMIDILNESIRDIIDSLQTDEELVQEAREIHGIDESGVEQVLNQWRPSQRSKFDVAYHHALREMTAVKAEKETAE